MNTITGFIAGMLVIMLGTLGMNWLTGFSLYSVEGWITPLPAFHPAIVFPVAGIVLAYVAIVAQGEQRRNSQS